MTTAAHPSAVSNGSAWSAAVAIPPAIEAALPALTRLLHEHKHEDKKEELIRDER